MDSIALFSGPQHVMIDCNEAMLETSGFDPRGMPAREAFPGYTNLQRLMDLCYRKGRSYEVEFPDGLWVTYPWHDASGSGIATAWRARQVVGSLPQTPPVIVAA